MTVMLTIWLCVSLLVLLLLAVLRQKVFLSLASRNGWKNLPPSPPNCLPILGHLPLFGDRAPGWQDRVYLDKLGSYGEMVYLQLGSFPVIMIHGPEAHRQLYGLKGALTSHRPVLVSGALYSEGRGGVVFSSASRWRKNRTFVHAQLFNPSKLLSAHGSIQDEAKDLVQRFDHQLERGEQIKGEDGVLFDVIAPIFEVSLNILGQIAFGLRFCSHSVDGKFSNPELATAITTIFEALAAPILEAFVPWVGKLRTHPILKELKRSIGVLRRWEVTVLELRRSTLDPQNPHNFADRILVELAKLSLPTPPSPGLNEETGKGDLTEETLLQDLRDMIIAGGETVSVSVTWAIIAFGGVPEKLKQAQEELDREVGDRDVILCDMEKLPYLIACIRESMRLYPIAMAPLFREVTEDLTVGDFFVPKGCLIHPNFYYLHRSPKFWKEDPTVFIPERFLENHERFDEATENKWVFQPFGCGPRSCVGENLAWLEIQLLVATLIQKFDFRLPKGWKYDPELKLTLRPEGGIQKMWVKKRK